MLSENYEFHLLLHIAPPGLYNAPTVFLLLKTKTKMLMFKVDVLWGFFFFFCILY